MRLWLFYLKYRWAVGLPFIVICLFVTCLYVICLLVLSCLQCFVFSCFVLFYEQGETDAFCYTANASIFLPPQRLGYTTEPRMHALSKDLQTPRPHISFDNQMCLVPLQMFITLYSLRTFELALSKDLQTPFQMFITLYSLRTFELALLKDLQTHFQMFITLYFLRTFELALSKDLQTPRYYITLGSIDDNASMELELTESQLDPFESVFPTELRYLFYKFHDFFNNDENQTLIDFIKVLPVGTDEDVLFEKVRACAFDLIETSDLNRIERFEALFPK